MNVVTKLLCGNRDNKKRCDELLGVVVDFEGKHWVLLRDDYSHPELDDHRILLDLSSPTDDPLPLPGFQCVRHLTVTTRPGAMDLDAAIELRDAARRAGIEAVTGVELPELSAPPLIEERRCRETSTQAIADGVNRGGPVRVPGARPDAPIDPVIREGEQTYPSPPTTGFGRLKALSDIANRDWQRRRKPRGPRPLTDE